MDQEIAAQLLKLEHRGWQALCSGSGAAFYGELMTEDGVMVLAHGYALERQAVVQSLENAPRWDSYDIADASVILLGPQQAVVRYTGTGRRRGEPDFVALMASVYLRVDGAWRLAHYQQTPAAHQ